MFEAITENGIQFYSEFPIQIVPFNTNSVCAYSGEYTVWIEPIRKFFDISNGFWNETIKLTHGTIPKIQTVFEIQTPLTVVEFNFNKKAFLGASVRPQRKVWHRFHPGKPNSQTYEIPAIKPEQIPQTNIWEVNEHLTIVYPADWNAALVQHEVNNILQTVAQCTNPNVVPEEFRSSSDPDEDYKYTFVTTERPDVSGIIMLGPYEVLFTNNQIQINLKTSIQTFTVPSYHGFPDTPITVNFAEGYFRSKYQFQRLTP